MSNEIRRLRRQANELERQIAEVRESTRQREQRLQEDYRIRLNELHTSMQRALDRHNEQEVRNLQRQAEELTRNLSQQIQSNYDELEQQLTRDLLNRHRELLQQIEDYYQRMQQYIDQNIVSSLQDSDEEKTALAQKEYAAALAAFEAVSGRAHEELFPGRLDIHRRSLDQAQLMMAQNQMEASAATSVMLAVKLKDFEYQIQEKIDQWLKSYVRMEQNYTAISMRVDKEVLTIDGQHISIDTAMHWLSPEYYVVFETLGRCKDVVDGIARYTGEEAAAEDGAERYIRTGTAPKSRELEELYRILKYQIPGLLRRMRTELATAYVCSAQRREWARQIAGYMKNQHNTGAAVYDGFGSEGEDADEKNLYCMKFCQPVADGKKHHYVFYIVPVVEDGATENHIRLYMDFRQGNVEFQKKFEYRFIRNLMKTVGVKHASVGIGTTPDVLEGSADEAYILRPAESGRGEALSHLKSSGMHSAEKDAPVRDTKTPGATERARYRKSSYQTV